MATAKIVQTLRAMSKKSKHRASNEELQTASGGSSRPHIEVKGAKEGETQIIKPDTPSDVTFSGVNKGEQVFG